MPLADNYVLEYSDGVTFEFSEHRSNQIFDVGIEIDIFEYNSRDSHREKARVTFKKDDLTYECDFCDDHNYENCFFPIFINGKRLICFRKTLYGLSLINADTLSMEYEYFPEAVARGEESFIITVVKQLDNILIFEGCYWACPYECFAFDYDQKRFLNVSAMSNIASLDKTVTQNDRLIIHGTDKNNAKAEFAISKQDLISCINKHGETDF